MVRANVRTCSILAFMAIGVLGTPAMAQMLDVTGVTVFAPIGDNVTQAKAVDMLLDGVEARTGVRWPMATTPGPTPTIAIGLAGALTSAGIAADAPNAAESYRLLVRDGSIIVSGVDDRGVLYGVGRLLRELRMRRGSIQIPAPLDIATSPAFPIRGHQVGHRPKVNTYDGWTGAMYEQYIREMAVFGVNAIELIPPRSDDAPDSPHFVKPQIEMLAEVSQLAHDYSMDFWIWYPAMDPDYTDRATIDKALQEWSDVFKRVPDIDAIFVPGGDPGHTAPTVLFNLLEKVTVKLHESHPEAEMWMSPQSFDAASMDEFYGLMAKEPAWLSGIVFGPQNRVGLPELRAKLPAKYPIRRYPDITHTIRCQYPVPDWDVAFPLTENRECINPRPMHYAHIFRLWGEHAAGFITYSEGVNDDANKMLWSALGWDPEVDVNQVMREYARFFMGPDVEEGVAQAYLALERNWQGPLLTNAGVDTTLVQVMSMEREATPWLRHQWRFLQLMYRAYYDAYLRARLVHEVNAEARALDVLRRAGELNPVHAMAMAESILDNAEAEPVGADLRARVLELAEGLYQAVRMQLSVPRYQAIDAGRGANLDLIDMPLNNRDWLKAQFASLRTLEDDTQRLQGIHAIVNWQNPGAGGFYDDLGNPSNQPHLVRNADAWTDPEHRIAPLVGFHYSPGMRTSWIRHAESRYDAGLQMSYTGLDTNATYTLKVVYGGDRRQAKIKCVTEDGSVVHDFVAKPFPFAPLEFDLPVTATADGNLTLTWYQEPGQGGGGRGCQVSEVWLIRK